MKLNRSRDYATIHGHPIYSYQQDDKFFDGLGNQVDEDGKTIQGGKEDDKIIQTDGVDTAISFLKNLLGGGPMAKAILFQQAEGMHLAWDDVKKAAVSLKITTQTTNKQEFWKLPEVA